MRDWYKEYMKNIVTQANEHGNIVSSYLYFQKFGFAKDKKILEIGCSYGSLLFNLYDDGYKDVQGIDIDEEFVKCGKKTYKSIADKINLYNGVKIPFDDETFDVVLMFDVIEHIPRVHLFIKNEISRVLKKDGFFIFQTPNKYPNIIWQMVNQRSFVKWRTSEHCSLQTTKSLRNSLKEGQFYYSAIGKHTILTQLNFQKIKKKIGPIGVPLRYLLQSVPLFLYTNLWGYAKK